MSDEHKKRVEAALNKYFTKQLPKPIKHNKKPEAEFVLILLNHLKDIGFSIDVVEAKGVYSEDAQRYIHGKTRPGFSDFVGNDPSGHSVYIEVKAPGKRSTLRPEQREFLIEKISTNAFAIVCDSVEYFTSTYANWRQANNKKAYLLKELPDLAPRWAKEDLDLFDIKKPKP